MRKYHAHGIREYDSFVFHPYNIIMFVALFALSAMFISLTVAFVYTRVQSKLPPLDLPDIFVINTLLLLAGSFALNHAKKAYEHDRTKIYMVHLLFAIILSIVFLLSQIWGWSILFEDNILPATNNSSGYLYLLSGLHFVHVIFIIPFLVWFYLRSRRQLKEPASQLVYFSDKSNKLKLRLLTIYWHFLDILWVYLVVFFFINAHI